MSDWKERAEALSAHLRRELGRHLAGRRFVLFGGPVVGIAVMGAQLRSLGGEPFLLGANLGAGPVPDPSDMPWCHLGTRGRSVMDEFRRAEARYPNPPARVQRAVDRFDPERRARSAAAFTMGHVPGAAGRRRFGARPKRWLALEDKTRIERLWRDLDIPHAPSSVVPAEPGALRHAAERLDRGLGTVWAADAKRGVHGGAEGTYWVGDRDEIARAARRLSRDHDRVRVMPFLPGTPCSIHGIVLPRHTVVLRPVEMVVLRVRGARELRYSGVSTFWDPPDRDRQIMRRTVRRIGEALRDRVGFRGPFTIDGVLGPDGFQPTELNARQGGALATVTAGLPSLPITWLCLAATAGLDLDWQPRRMERVLLEVADRRRAGRAMARTGHPTEETSTHALASGRRGPRRARNREETVANLVVGPGGAGTFVGWMPRGNMFPLGESLARPAAEALGWCDRVLDTGIGPLEPVPGASP